MERKYFSGSFCQSCVHGNESRLVQYPAGNKLTAFHRFSIQAYRDLCALLTTVCMTLCLPYFVLIAIFTIFLNVFFRPFGHQFVLKIRKGGRVPRPFPWIRHCFLTKPIISSESVRPRCCTSCRMQKVSRMSHAWNVWPNLNVLSCPILHVLTYVWMKVKCRHQLQRNRSMTIIILLKGGLARWALLLLGKLDYSSDDARSNN